MIVMKHRFPSGVLSSETPRDNQSLLGLLHGEPRKPSVRFETSRVFTSASPYLDAGLLGLVEGAGGCH